MAADLDAMSGDVAGLIDYRRHHGGMSYAPPRRNAICELHVNGDKYEFRGWHISGGPGGREGVLIASDITKQILHPDDAVTVFPDIATGGRCATCYSTDRAVVIGPICPDDWHDGPHETHWRRIAILTTALTAAAAALLALFLFTIGVLHA